MSLSRSSKGGFKEFDFALFREAAKGFVLEFLKQAHYGAPPTGRSSMGFQIAASESEMTVSAVWVTHAK